MKRIKNGKKAKIDTGAAIRLHYQAPEVKEYNLKRGMVVKVSAPGGEAYRVLLLTTNLVAKDEVAMDYDTQLQLGVSKKSVAEIHVKPAGRVGMMKFVWNHPDPSIQIGARAAVYLTAFAIAAGEVLGWLHRIL